MVVGSEFDEDGFRLALAATWNPRGELSRFERLLPILKDVYAFIALSFPPGADPSVTEIFSHGRYRDDPKILQAINHEWSWGRYTALKLGLDTTTDYIQYADMDRVLRWIETHHDEWRSTAHKVKKCECLIIGRTVNAYGTHPEALKQTEAVSNRVVSYFLNQVMDVSAGSKGFSRRAAEYIVNNSSPGHALGTDSEWPILLYHAGFKIDYIEVDGLTWESADRYRNRTANADEQLRAAMDYDVDPKNWSYRVNVADEIVQLAIQTSMRTQDREERL